MAESESSFNKFDIYDFFSFILPGFLLLLPLFAIPSLLTNLRKSLFGHAIQTTPIPRLEFLAIVLVLSYMLGVLVYYLGRLVERNLLEVNGPPSHRCLRNASTSALLPPVPAMIRSSAQQLFQLPKDSSDPQIFSLIFRYVFEFGNSERIRRFIHLQNLTRGITMVVSFWFVIFLILALTSGPKRPYISGIVISGILAVIANFVRRAYSRDIAEEVYVAYYAHLCGCANRADDSGTDQKTKDAIQKRKDE